MILSNCLFRLGGAAILLSNKRKDASRAKYQLLTTVRVHKVRATVRTGCVAPWRPHGHADHARIASRGPLPPPSPPPPQGRSDEAYQSVFQTEDSTGHVGVRLSKGAWSQMRTG